MGARTTRCLSGLLQLELGPDVVLVSSAEETAKDVYATLVGGDAATDDPTSPDHEFLSTGDPDRFRELAEVFLGGHELARVDAVHLEKEGSWS